MRRHATCKLCCLSTSAFTPSGSGTATTDRPAPDDPSGPVRRTPGPPVKYALIALGLALLIFVAGILGEAFFGSAPSSPPSSSVSTVKSSPLKAVAAKPDLGPLVTDGEPPEDIVNSVVIPAGSSPGAVIDNTASAEAYDEQRQFSLGTTEQKLITFFRVELPAQGWKVESTGPPKNQPGYEVLAQRAGSDGYYWEIGAVVSPTTFSASASKAGVTNFDIVLLQVTDSE